MDDTAHQYFRGLIATPDCKGCPLEGSKKILPEGDPRARLAIVNDGPSYEDEATGRCFSGTNGQMLNRLLVRAGIERESLWLTQTHLCKPKTVVIDDKPIAPDVVSRLAAKHCKARLDEELATVRPRVVIGFGAQSVRSVYAQGASLKGRRGAIHTLDLLQLDHAVEEELAEEDEDENEEQNGGTD
jgi:uracil-DNA glycosylase family 4